MHWVQLSVHYAGMEWDGFVISGTSASFAFGIWISEQGDEKQQASPGVAESRDVFGDSDDQEVERRRDLYFYQE